MIRKVDRNWFINADDGKIFLKSVLWNCGKKLKAKF